LQDADDGSIGGENAESNRSDYGSEEKYGHKKRDHNRSNLDEDFAGAPGPQARFLNRLQRFQVSLFKIRLLKSNRVDALRC
jgi:hypothetical protein